MMHDKTIQLQANQTFKWANGLRLSATDNVTIFFPGALVKQGEAVGSIIEVSDDNVQIGFRKSTNQDNAFDCIIVKLFAGASIRLHRASEALVVCDFEQSAILGVEN